MANSPCAPKPCIFIVIIIFSDPALSRPSPDRIDSGPPPAGSYRDTSHLVDGRDRSSAPCSLSCLQHSGSAHLPAIPDSLTLRAATLPDSGSRAPRPAARTHRACSRALGALASPEGARRGSPFQQLPQPFVRDGRAAMPVAPYRPLGGAQGVEYRLFHRPHRRLVERIDPAPRDVPQRVVVLVGGR